MIPELKNMMKLLLLASLLIHPSWAQTSRKAAPLPWQTLNGAEPLVIARGGFSGLFPVSSNFANDVAISTSLPNLVIYCNLQLSKDGVGFCLSDLRLDNSTNVESAYPKGKKSYKVNGQDVTGWFPIDYTAKQITQLSLLQSSLSRTNLFDNLMPVLTVDDALGSKPPGFWLNVQNDMFYNEHRLSPSLFVQKSLKLRAADYISSPEVNFLKAMNGKVRKDRTKLIFQVEGEDAIEPTTKQMYGSFLKNLASIKPFASGILVPKQYIWPVNKDGYLEAPTSLVTDAHRSGLEVYAYGFANDQPASFNYSYDPAAEYLQFVDNSNFSVDGVLTDFPPTASEAIGCLAHSKNGRRAGEKDFLVITNNGASGVYPASTDLAYQQAVADGADIIDCSVQMSKDGVAFCLSTPDLADGTSALTAFMTHATLVPEIKPKNGIFSFDLTWSEIQTLKPQLTSSIIPAQALPRNPANKNKGKFMTLKDFLDFAKQKAVPGILIDVEHAGYLASKKGLDLIDTVTGALSNATFDKQSTQQVLIQSDDSAVLSKFKNISTYQKVLNIEQVVGGAPRKPVEEIKEFADAVRITRGSDIKVTPDGFSVVRTNVVEEMHAANISVYVGIMRNEFTTIPVDQFSDPMTEIATYRLGTGVDGIVTDYPGTAITYLRSPCADMDDNKGFKILPADAGALLGVIPVGVAPPATAPAPALTVADVVDPPLPPLTKASSANERPAAAAPVAAHPSGGASVPPAMNAALCLVVALFLILCF